MDVDTLHLQLDLIVPKIKAALIALIDCLESSGQTVAWRTEAVSTVNLIQSLLLHLRVLIP